VITWARWVRWRLNPYRQIDRLVARERGAGTAATVPFRLPRARYTLRAADGHVVELGGADATRDHRVGSAFLGAGEWTVEMITRLSWELVVSPVVGPTGGGARGF
jgi:hypothetical protein